MLGPVSSRFHRRLDTCDVAALRMLNGSAVDLMERLINGFGCAEMAA